MNGVTLAIILFLFSFVNLCYVMSSSEVEEAKSAKCEKKMSFPDLNEDSIKLKALEKFIFNVELDKFAKDKILKCIEFEIELLKYKNKE